MSSVASRTTIEAFNARLIVAGVGRISVREYLKRLNAEVYKLDIEPFADDLLDLVDRDDCCIPHTLLVKQGVISEKGASYSALRLMEQHGFVEGRDFNTTSCKSQGGRPAKILSLHPDAYEKILMRSKNVSTFADFYIIARKSIAGHEKFDRMLEKKHFTAEIKEKDGTIEVMMAEIRRMSAKADTNQAENKQQISGLVTKVDTVVQQNTELQAVVIRTEQKLDRTEQKLDKVAAVVYDASNRVGKVADRGIAIAEDVAPPPEDDRKVEGFTLVKLNNLANEYIALRLQERFLSTRLKKLRKNCPTLEIILQYSPAPNASSAWVRIRNVMTDRLVFINTACVQFTLGEDTTEDDLITCIREVFDEPKTQAKLVSQREKEWARARVVVVAAMTAAIMQMKPPVPEYNLDDADVEELLDELDDEPGEEGQ